MDDLNLLTKEHYQDMANKCLIRWANEIRRIRTDAYLDGLIGKDEFYQYSLLEKDCRDKADALIISEMNEIVTDIDEPLNRIIVATNEVSSYLKKIDDMKKIIPAMTKFASILVSISSAIMSGNPLVAIASQIGELEKIIQES